MKRTLNEVYNDLNEVKKAELRKAFSEHFEYSADAFYKKKNKPDGFKRIEREFIASHLKASVIDLFETKGGVNA